MKVRFFNQFSDGLRSDLGFYYFSMRKPKNPFSSSEIKFSYYHYPELAMLNSTIQLREILLTLWAQQCQCNVPKRYVLFLNSRNQFIAWKHLPIDLEYRYYYYANEIAGIAIACNAKSVVLSYNQLNRLVYDSIDECLVNQTIKNCKAVKVAVIDYLILTKNEWFSFKSCLRKHQPTCYSL